MFFESSTKIKIFTKHVRVVWVYCWIGMKNKNGQAENEHLQDWLENVIHVTCMNSGLTMEGSESSFVCYTSLALENYEYSVSSSEHI